MTRHPDHVRKEALRLYDETETSINEIAEKVGVDNETVRKWVTQPDTLQRLRGMRRYKNRIKARRYRVLELAAMGHSQQEIADQLGLTNVRNVRRLLDRALRETCEDLRNQDTWERARALHLKHHEALLAKWLPAALDMDFKSAELALKILAQIAQISGFNLTTIQTVNRAETTVNVNLTPAEIGDVLAGLDVLAARLNPALPAGVIDGQLAQGPEPVGEQHGHPDLGAQDSGG